MPFEGFDFTDFWEDSEYAREAYINAPPTEELIASVEEELGYKLPESYIWLMKQQNGGIPVNTCFPTKVPTSWAEDHVAITGIFGIGREKSYSLCGSLGSQFMIDIWEYPPIGVAICDCPSAGHDMIFLDYHKCGRDGEPEVVHVDQEADYRITPLADSFEAFIRGLVNGEEFEEDEEERKDAELEKVQTAPFSPLLMSLCGKTDHPELTEEWIRFIALELVEEKGFFAMHSDEKSMLLYDIQFWLYENSDHGVTEEAYLEAYPKMIELAAGFGTGGYAPSFIKNWLKQRREEGEIIEMEGRLTMSGKARDALLEKRSLMMAENSDDLMDKIDRWYALKRHRKIVDAVMALPREQRTDDLLGRMAVAYNNLDEYDNAIQVLEELRPRQENTPRFHYRLGYALYYSDHYPEAREAFTRALMLNPPEDIAEDCRDFLEWITEDYQEGEEYKQRREESEGIEPELYSDEEMKAVEQHITQYYGEYKNVWHEIVSPDIHVDICLILPTEEKNYYTLVTMGMGAHKMKVPEELLEYHLDRAELVICLPADWKLGVDDEAWYWPVRLLKQLARLPGNCDTWLGWGHTVDNQKPFDENTGLSGSILISPQNVEDGAETAVLPDGEQIQFYQVLPLFREEMVYKQTHDADALFQAMGAVSFVVDPLRPCKVEN